MKNFIKYAFAYGLGAATGAFVTVKLLEDHYAEIAEQEIQEAKQEYRCKLEERQKALDGEASKDNKVKNLTNAYDKIFRTENKEKIDYTKPSLDELSGKYDKLAESEHPLDDDEEDAYNNLSDPEELRANDKIPYLLTEDEYAHENPEYDKVTLFYYKKDETLADENEIIIDDIPYHIGDSALEIVNDIADKLSGDNRMLSQQIYVRNENLEIDFEIICLNKSYKEEVLDIIKEE